MMRRLRYLLPLLALLLPTPGWGRSLHRLRALLLIGLLGLGVMGPGASHATELGAEACGGAGDLGANWTTVTGFVTPQQVSGVCEPVAVAGNGSISLYTGTAWPDDQEAQMAINTLATSNTRIASVVLRGTTAARTQYECTDFGPIGSSATIRIYRYNAGAATIGVSGTATWASTDVLKCTVTTSGADAIVKFFQNGSELLSWTDTTPIASGSPGMVLYTGAGAVTNVQIDNWQGSGNLPNAGNSIGWMEVDE